MEEFSAARKWTPYSAEADKNAPLYVVRIPPENKALSLVWLMCVVSPADQACVQTIVCVL